MSVRIGVDMDGTLADLGSTYRDYERRLFGTDSHEPHDDEAEGPDGEMDDAARVKMARESKFRRDAIWKALVSTTDLWTLLRPLEPGVIAALYAAMLEHKWEVFFITQRPPSAGNTVQLQTQRWLIQHGFETPSVVTVSGSRGKVAASLELDFLIDDLPKNCVDVVSDSRCRPVLLLRRPNDTVEATAKGLNIGVVRSFAEVIALLTHKAPNESTVARVLRKLGLTGART